MLQGDDQFRVESIFICKAHKFKTFPLHPRDDLSQHHAALVNSGVSFEIVALLAELIPGNQTAGRLLDAVSTGSAACRRILRSAAF